MLDLPACLRGEKGGWDAFVAEAAPIVLAAIRRTLPANSPDTAEDLAQEVFLRLVRDNFRLLRTYEPDRASLSTWLTLVARSTTLDHLRRRRLPTVPLDEARDPAAPAPAEPMALKVPPGLLSPRQQLVLRLLYERELSVAEAAAALGVDPQTIRSTRHKAIARLRRHFGEP